MKIAWILPGLIIGGGGHRNIIRCAYQLEQRGHDVSLHFIDTADDDATNRRLVRAHFYPFEGHIGVFDADSARQNDVVMATHWSTVKFAESIRGGVGEIIYFVQDYEPSFYAMGSEHVLAEATYRKGLYAITSGIWCQNVLRNNFGMEADYFQFPIDRSTYFDSETAPRSNRILFFAKPEMTRRCFELGVEALRRFHRLRPDVEIAFFGSDSTAHHRMDFPVTQLGLLPTISDLAALYRSSRAGIVFSTTNPSLVPYEMMACGLPIFDLGRPGNEQNYGDRFDIARLVNPDPSVMAGEIAALFEDEAQLRERSRKGLEFVKSFPTEEEVGECVEALILQRVSKWSETRLTVSPQMPEVSSVASARGLAIAHVGRPTDDRLEIRRQASPNSAATKPGSWRAVTDAEINCLMEPSFRDEVALFVTHSPNGGLKPHVRHYLDVLKRQGIAVILTVSADTSFTAADANLFDAIDGLFVRRNEGYDFAAWAHLFHLYPELFDAKILYLLNDSLIGPTNHTAFRDLLRKLRNSPADFIGLTESLERGWHIQSYFIAFKPRALSSAAFHKFIEGIVSYDSKDDVINEFEIKFATALKAAGLNCEVMFPTTDLRNPTIYHWEQLLESGFPYLKVMTIRDAIPGVDVSNWRKLLAEQGYDVSLAERTLAELAAPAPVAEGL